jgi:hypothetical protein
LKSGLFRQPGLSLISGHESTAFKQVRRRNMQNVHCTAKNRLGVLPRQFLSPPKEEIKPATALTLHGIGYCHFPLKKHIKDVKLTRARQSVT